MTANRRRTIALVCALALLAAVPTIDIAQARSLPDTEARQQAASERLAEAQQQLTTALEPAEQRLADASQRVAQQDVPDEVAEQADALLAQADGQLQAAVVEIAEATDLEDLQQAVEEAVERYRASSLTVAQVYLLVANESLVAANTAAQQAAVVLTDELDALGLPPRLLDPLLAVTDDLLATTERIAVEAEELQQRTLDVDTTADPDVVSSELGAIQDETLALAQELGQAVADFFRAVEPYLPDDVA